MGPLLSPQNTDIKSFLMNFRLKEENCLFYLGEKKTTKIENVFINNKKYPRFINEYWTAKQRQASSLHEVSYRACFKPQLPRFFIELFSKEGDTVYDPFSGRGTTALEAALMNRNIIANDINPLSTILAEARLYIPNLIELKERLESLPINYKNKAGIDLSMFYHSKTEAEIVSLRNYLESRKNEEFEDEIDKWIRMVATNRLTGHSAGFFSVYTLPPNQAIAPERQRKINAERNQVPLYRDIKRIIFKKSLNLIRDVDEDTKEALKEVAGQAKFLTLGAGETIPIKDCSVQLTITSPPFLDVVQYVKDNWLRCWFNNINVNEVEGKITMAKNIGDWIKIMSKVFEELYRITKKGGWVAFEVGEVKNGKINLDEHVVPLGENNRFECKGILINEQYFTKTANIWGVKNNGKGTNTNRIVIFYKNL